jgi:hypothetical protein
MFWSYRKSEKLKDVERNCNTYYGGNKEKGRSRKRWRDEVEEDLNIL